MAVMVMVEVMVMGAATVVAMDMATVVAAYREGSDNWPLLPESDGSKVREKNSKEIRDACEEEEEK